MNTTILKTSIAVVAAVVVASLAVAADDKSSNVDELLIAAQKICPISGGKLGSMGKPIKTTVNDTTIFLCCKGCVGKSPSKENWSKVAANLRTAQDQCPVDHKALPTDAASIVIKNRMLFVCCKECLEKVKADPDKYIAIVDDLLKENLNKSQQK